MSALLSGVQFQRAYGQSEGSEALTGKIVGIYFSAHWCPPCRAFTPQLADFYNRMKALGRNLEIVFASSDRDQESFDDYRAEMPWLALPFAEQNIKEALSQQFGVSGIPSLIFLNADGSILSNDGRNMVTSDSQGNFLLASGTGAPSLKRQLSAEGKRIFAEAVAASNGSVNVKEAKAALIALRRGGPQATIALKTLRTLIKNVVNHPTEQKYLTINLANAAIQERLGRIPECGQFLTAMGFCQNATANNLSIEASVLTASVLAEFRSVQQYLDEAVLARMSTTAPPLMKKQPPQTKQGGLSAKKRSGGAPQMSMKQQALLMQEEREKKARAEKQAERAGTLKSLKQDKRVRKHDPNWKSGVSAAAGKGGVVMKSFRDKFGEDQGGG